MLTVTFYSYKGGVGRTMALLNVAARLVALGKKVVLLDLDLEAPGLGHAQTTRAPSDDGRSVAGVSDFVFDRLEGKDYPISHYLYSVTLWQGDAQVISAGTRATELSRKVAQLVTESSEESPLGNSLIFENLLAEIEQHLAPDFVFIDSRTGRADIAGVCTMELPEVIVACCGLSEQNVTGMSDALDMIWKYHDSAGLSVLTLLALGPVPPRTDEVDRSTGTPRRLEQLFRRVVNRVEQRWTQARRFFPETSSADVIHTFPYDPWAVFEDELVQAPGRQIDEAYGKLTNSLRRATGEEGLNLVDSEQTTTPSQYDANWLVEGLARLKKTPG
jgi:MinD-like ATPase involved in chromosome partitioning or flagellar assembly